MKWPIVQDGGTMSVKVQIVK